VSASQLLPAPAVVRQAGAKSPRILELDGLRAFAIIPVMLHHCWPTGVWWSFVGEAGWMGVDLFFVLSGYLITGILLKSKGEKNGYRQFLGRRALRIFPLYYLCLALFTAVAIFRPDHASWEAMKAWGGVGWFVVYLGNIHAAWMNSLPPVLSFATLWSLQVEEQFYLLFPIAVALLSLPNLRRFLIGCGIAAPLLRSALAIFAAHKSVAGYVLMPCRMDALAMGGILAILFRSGARPQASHARVACTMSAAVAAGLFFAALWHHPGATAYDPVMRSVGYSVVDFTCASLLCWILLSPTGAFTRVLRWRALVYTGQIAYGLYLLHEPVSWMARRLLGNIETHSVFSVPITFAASFLAAGISWRFFESPFLALKDRLQMRESVHVRLSGSQAGPRRA
jgi:peptidoglycan/LPS O-acetylase OafA/YrhL